MFIYLENPECVLFLLVYNTIQNVINKNESESSNWGSNHSESLVNTYTIYAFTGGLSTWKQLSSSLFISLIKTHPRLNKASEGSFIQRWKFDRIIRMNCKIIPVWYQRNAAENERLVAYYSRLV